MIPGRYAQAAVAKLVFEWAGLVFGVCMYCSMGSYLLHGDVTFNSLWSIGKRIATTYTLSRKWHGTHFA
jgi:hypothetical protein